jgi:hypothetical protein
MVKCQRIATNCPGVSMNLIEYMMLDEQHALSADDLQSLNSDLSVRSRSDIPEEYKDRVADYIIAALNMEAVEPKLVPSIQKLLQDLQQDK